MVVSVDNQDNDHIERKENELDRHMQQSNIASSDPPQPRTANRSTTNENDKVLAISATSSSSSIDNDSNSAFIATDSQQLQNYCFSPETKSKLAEILTSMPMFSLTDDDIQIQYRKKLGHGSFCAVYPIYIKNTTTNNTFDTELPELFAIKKLKLDIVQSKKTNMRLFEEAYDDLYEEAMIMKGLQHGNIIQMFGMREIGSEEKDKEKFFVVIEQLSSTLDSHIMKWRNDMQGIFFRQEITSPVEVNRRLNNVVMGISHGLQYLHSQNFCYRDLKPANIGFDLNGNVKIFDFGLVVRLSPSSSESKIKGKAGTIRYMAPEMKKGQSYDCSVDIYSFGILTWQVITSKLPFEKEIPLSDFFCDNNEQKENILQEGLRPDLAYIENENIISLLKHCWDEDPNERWNFDQIIPELESIIKTMNIEEESEKVSGKSSCVNRNEVSSVLSMRILHYIFLFVTVIFTRIIDMNKSLYGAIQGKLEAFVESSSSTASTYSAIDNQAEGGKDEHTEEEKKDSDDKEGKQRTQVV